MFRAFEKLMPEHWAVLKDIQTLKSDPDYSAKLKNLFGKFVKISIDFGIMEKFANTYVVPVDFGWNDIGSYPALSEVFPSDENNNIVRNVRIREFNSLGNIVIGSAKNGQPEKTIALLGVHDMVIVETPDTILVCSKEEAQNIKKIL